MTRPALVLVTGSRALAGHREARMWVLDRLDALAPKVVVTGDASGPDAWATDWARYNALTLRIYDGRGRVLDAESSAVARWSVSSHPAADAIAPQWAAWYLHRDRVMVQHVARRADRYAVTVVAARALWSPTNGTAFTIARARAAGLDVAERAWSTRAVPA